MKLFSVAYRIILCLLVTTQVTVASGPALQLNEATLRSLADRKPQDILVVYGDTEYDTAVNNRSLSHSRAASSMLRTNERLIISRLQQESQKDLIGKGVSQIYRYKSVPVSLVRIKDEDALLALSHAKHVRGIYQNKQNFTSLNQTLPLIGQNVAQANGFQGQGKSVAIIDTGIDHTNSAFGCTAVGVPSSCKVVVRLDCTRSSLNGGCRENTGTLLSGTHGTNVAAIVAGVAPSAKLISMNVFIGGVAYDADIIAAFDWLT